MIREVKRVSVVPKYACLLLHCTALGSNKWGGSMDRLGCSVCALHLSSPPGVEVGVWGTKA